MDTNFKNYEVAYLINSNIPEDGVFSEAGKITGFIQDAHGLVGRIEEPKARRLAYPIEKLTSAFFGWTTFAITSEKITEIEKRIRQEKNIIRHLIVEEIKRPVPKFWPRPRPAGGPPRAERRPSAPPLEDVKPFTPAPPKEEDKTKIEELDKRLEEILGK